MRYNVFYERFNEMVNSILENYTDDDFLTDYQISTETNKALKYLLNTVINHRDHVIDKNNNMRARIYVQLFDIISRDEMSESGFHPIDVLKKIREANKQLKLEIDQIRIEIENLKQENRMMKEEILQAEIDICGENNTVNIIASQSKPAVKPNISQLLQQK